MSGVEFVKGAQHLKNYKLPEAQHFTHTFCGICGSGMPRIDHSRGIAVIPLGALDDDPVSRPVDHIYVSSKASWFEITDNLTVFNHGPE
jgi:hypothetical protein